MITTIRTTTGRENVVIGAIANRIKSQKIPIKSLFHPADLRGYVFIEGESGDIEAASKGVPHVRGLIDKSVSIEELESFLVPEKSEVVLEMGDVVEIIGSPFKGEKARITRIDEAKNELTVEFLEAAIPIPVTIPTTSVRLHEKKRSR